MLRYWEMQELACAALGMSQDQCEKFINDNEDLDGAIYDAFEISFDQFCEVAEALLKLTPKMKSPISGESHNCFVRQVESGYLAIIKSKPEGRS